MNGNYSEAFGSDRRKMEIERSPAGPEALQYPRLLDSRKNQDHVDSSMFGYQTDVDGQVPLKTPDRRLSSLDKTALEVRKRLLSPSSDHGASNIDKRQRQVAKSLFGESQVASTTGEENKPRKTARCLYGPPSQDENDKLLKEFDAKSLKDYEAFQKRYEITEEIV